MFLESPFLFWFLISDARFVHDLLASLSLFLFSIPMSVSFADGWFSACCHGFREISALFVVFKVHAWRLWSRFVSFSTSFLSCLCNLFFFFFFHGFGDRMALWLLAHCFSHGRMYFSIFFTGLAAMFLLLMHSSRLVLGAINCMIGDANSLSEWQ